MSLVVTAASQDAFGVVLVVVVVVATVIAIATFIGAPALYDQIGRGGMSINEDGGDRARSGSGGGAAVDTRERDAEIRQMLTARNARRERRGEEPLDIEAELQRLTAPVIDAGLRDEIRQLVIARNARRARRGEEPLDVEAEIERQVRELG